LWLTTDAKIGATIGRKIAMTNKTAVRKKVALAMTSASANRKIAAKMMKPKAKKRTRRLKLTLEPAKQPERENPALGRVFFAW
jgi:hypothetical protein